MNAYTVNIPLLVAAGLVQMPDRNNPRIPRCITCSAPAQFLPNRKRFSVRCEDCNARNRDAQRRFLSNENPR